MRTAWIPRTLAWASLAAIGAALVVGAVGSESARHTVVADGPACPFRTVTGVDCPFCGMTRATLALGGGHVRTALSLHPVAPLVLLLVVAVLLVIATGRIGWLRERHRALWLLAGVGIVWLVRLAA